MKKIVFFSLLAFSTGSSIVYDQNGNYISQEHLAKKQILNSRKLITEAAKSYVAGDYLSARQKYEKACNIGNPLGCSGLGTIYERGLSVIKNLRTARMYYKKACEKKDAFGCLHLSLINQGENAIELFTQGCDEQDAKSCYLLGLLYFSGKSVSRDVESALNFYKKACDLQNPLGCFNAGGIYEFGTDTIDANKDLSLAYFQLSKRYLNQECQNGNQSSCNMLSQGKYLSIFQ